jgi:hypothetical protein
MISNERPSPYGSNRPYNSGYNSGPPKPRVDEDTLKTDKVQIERKTFIFTLKENPRGRFLRITEDVNGRRDNVIIPATGLEEFKKILDDMVKASAEIPPKNPDAQPGS